MKQRIYTALVGIPVLIASVWYGDPWIFLAIISLVGIVGIFEFYSALRNIEIKPVVPIGITWTVLFILSPLWDNPQAFPLLLLTAMIFSFVWLVLRKSKDKLFINWLWTISGILYIGWLLSYYTAIRNFNIGNVNYGRELLLLVIFCTFACDTSAFLVGRTWGKHLWIPSISPKKTWEGCLAGFSGAVLCAIILDRLLNLPLSLTVTLLTGGVIGVFAQLGDLFESVFKRSVGVKDSGKILPGHGGILDRLDSLVFNGCVIYYLMLWVVL